MQRILTLNPPYQGMSAIVNVLSKVGPDGPNNPDDVRVVQRLCQMAGKSAFAKGIGLPQTTGHYDASTGFWIYQIQNALRSHGHSNQVVDGTVSPAHGSVFAKGAAWTIVVFNYWAKRTSPADYTAFLNQMR